MREKVVFHPGSGDLRNTVCYELANGTELKSPMNSHSTSDEGVKEERVGAGAQESFHTVLLLLLAVPVSL